MITRIELAEKENFYDAEGRAVQDGARDLGIRSITAVQAFRVDYLLGKITDRDKQHIA